MKKYVALSLFILTMQSVNPAHALISSCTNYLTTMEGELISPLLEPAPLSQYAPLASTTSSTMTKERFIELIDKATAIFQPFFNKAGATLTVNKRWDDKNEDISSSQWPNGNWRVTMTGGFARHPMISEDGFMMALCHEIGHHIGGAPRGNNNTSWGATEGQADYFASLKCFKRLIEKDDNMAIVATMTIDPEVTNRCKTIYKTSQDIALCQRTAMAGYSVANLIASRSETPVIKFNTPDRSTVSKTMEDAPYPQCRLDTFFQGTICDKSIDEEVSKDNPRIGTCNSKEGYTVGLRPRCWYSPSNEI